MTLKHDAPVDRDLNEFKLKEIDKDKLYTFLREMEFNRLLSSVISTYGEPSLMKNNKISSESEKQSSISKKNYYLNQSNI